MIRILLASALTALTGCAGAAIFDSGRLSTNTGRVNFATIAGGRDMSTQIVGNPFAIPDDLFADSVTAIFNQRNSRTPSNFTTRPGPSAAKKYRLVLVFNPAKRGPASRICNDPEAVQLAPPSTRPIRLQIAFCQGSQDITARHGRLPNATGPQDPVFQNFMAQALMLTQPTRNQVRPFG